MLHKITFLMTLFLVLLQKPRNCPGLTAEIKVNSNSKNRVLRPPRLKNLWVLKEKKKI